jgi:hypothetical protein
MDVVGMPLQKQKNARRIFVRTINSQMQQRNLMTPGKWCVVHRKYGEVEHVWRLTPETGASREEADKFRKEIFASAYGDLTGKHTTHTELLSDHKLQPMEN